MRLSTIVLLIILAIVVVGCACEETKDDSTSPTPPPDPGGGGGTPTPPTYPPVFVQDIPGFTNVLEDSPAFEHDLGLYATDSPNDPNFTPQPQLVWTVNGFDANIINVVILNNHIARFIPRLNGFGETQAAFTVTDLTGLTASRTIAIHLANVADPPTITSAPITTATANNAYSYTVVAIDPDEDTITYSLTEHPPGMIINPNSGVVSWTPQSTGQYGVTVRPIDSTGRFSLQSFEVSVS